MIRLIAAARTAMAVLAFLIGGPVVLTATAGPPLPHRPPSGQQLHAWLDDPLNPVYAAGTARLAAWSIWALICTAICATIAAHLRRLRWSRLAGYLPRPTQSLTAALLGTAAIATTVTNATGTPSTSSTATTDPHHLDLTPAAANAPSAAHHASSAASANRTTHRHNERVPASAANAPGCPHRVVRGDTLWDIARQQLGDPRRWPEIYQLNRGHDQANGYALTDPDEIDVGWVLALPTRHLGAQPIDPQVTQEPSVPARPSTQPTTPWPSASSAASPSSQDDGGDGLTGPPSQSPGSSAPSSAPTSSTSSVSPPVPGSASPATGRDQAPSASRLDGVDLPGGWVTLGLGGGLLAAVAMVWRRRRHRYQPTPITSPRLNDADLLPPLAAMTRIRTSLRRVAPETLDEQPAPAPTVHEYLAAAVKPELPPVGPSGSDLAGVAALPLATGLGLAGDGALDAARGLLVATLASGSDDDPDAKGRAIISADTLATLLGVPAVDLGHLDRLTVTATTADAITQLEEEIIRRSRLIADAQAADARRLRDNDVHAEPLPQLLLIAKPPESAWTNRLVTAIRLGHSVDIGAAVLGDWPTGTTLTVAADGTTGSDDAPRLAVLDTAAAIDMLGMLREAHGGNRRPAHAEPPAPRAAAAAAEPDPAADQETVPGDHAAAPTAAPPATSAPDTASRLPVTVRVLGRPAVLDHNGQPSPGIRSKAIELLVYLAVNRHGADLSDIMEALFPDANMRRAKERLSTVAADLRKHIRQAAAPADSDQTGKQRLEPIPNTGSRYHLDHAIVRVDWWTVLDQYEATAAATDNDQRLSHLTAAVEAAGGALAEGVDYDWIDTDREVVRRHRIKLHAHAAALLANTDPHRSWLLLEQACQIDPLSDELARTTMRAAAALGDADAIRHRLKILRDSLDAHCLELSDETEALARELLRKLHPPRPPE